MMPSRTRKTMKYLECRNKNKSNCLMCSSTGYCTALKDTDFGGGPCPFFKPKNTTAEKKKKAPVKRTHKLKHVKSLDKIPKFSLSLERIMVAADRNINLLTVDSENSNYKYISDKDEIMIISKYDGYLRIPLGEVKDLISELNDVIENVELWKRTSQH